MGPSSFSLSPTILSSIMLLLSCSAAAAAEKEEREVGSHSLPFNSSDSVGISPTVPPREPQWRRCFPSFPLSLFPPFLPSFPLPFPPPLSSISLSPRAHFRPVFSARFSPFPPPPPPPPTPKNHLSAILKVISGRTSGIARSSSSIVSGYCTVLVYGMVGAVGKIFCGEWSSSSSPLLFFLQSSPLSLFLGGVEV